MKQDSDVDAALESQQLLLENSLNLVFTAYDDAIEAKVRDPVVFLLDCEDAIGGEIARSWLGDDLVDEAIAMHSIGSGSRNEQIETTVYAFAFPWIQCCDEIPQVFSYLAPVFDKNPPTDGFLAIAVTSGGASALTVPFSARE